MHKLLKRLTAVISIGVSAAAINVAGTAPAQAYPIDCAILLCLAGGWPSSAPCSAAYAEVVRRITPLPVEPPLQIWNCPLGVSYTGPSINQTPFTPRDVIYALDGQPALPGEPKINVSDLLYKDTEAADMRETLLKYVTVSDGPNGEADIDISDGIWDFVRSIHVYDVNYNRDLVGTNSDNERCWTRASRVRIGYYGTQGDFRWQNFHVKDAPGWMDVRLTNTNPDERCPFRGNYRGVGIDWTDYFGAYGFDVIRY
ncbi:MAG: hypothetical protein ABGX47_07280 [Martelella sp.]|uniref:hypothetical protein n=1 Tax=Martelella sp. TaxID=1969699 RepID=UPI003241DDE3